MNTLSPGHSQRGDHHSILSWIAAVAALAGLVAIGFALHAQRAAPTPPASAAGRVSAPGNTHEPPQPIPSVGAAKQHPLPVSRPRQIDIPAIGVHSAVIAVGKNKDGTLRVPQPGPDLDKAAWYHQSPTPGRPGPSVIVGHVDTTEGPSIFFDLGNVRPGDRIRVTRQNKQVLTFTVDGVRNYPDKADFPTQLVYGGDLSQPTLRLVTCSNFDEEIGHYLGNLVVFAHLTAVHQTKT